jgi:hypothetical protein
MTFDQQTEADGDRLTNQQGNEKYQLKYLELGSTAEAWVKVSRKYVRGMKLALGAVSLTVGFLFVELAVRYLRLGDKMGWSMVPSVSERVAKTGVANRGKARILVLGDSMTEWRDNTGESYVRIAERMLPSIEVVNLAEGGTDLPSYLSNLLRFGERLRPDLILIGLYVGNDLFPSTPPLESAEMRSALEALPSPSQELTLKRIAKRSVLLNYGHLEQCRFRRVIGYQCR